MKVLVVSAGHADLVGDDAARVADALFQGLREREGVEAVLLAAVDRSIPALFKPGAHITAFDGKPDEYLFLSHDVDPWWHGNGEPLLLEAYVAFLGLIRPDVVHVHDIRRLGADLLTLTRRVLPDCRIVLTLPDFLPICVAGGAMIRLTDGAPCARASPARCHQCCPDIAPEQHFLRRAALLAHLRAADVVTVPGRFMVERFIRWGVPADKLVHVPGADAATACAAAAADRRTRFGYFGDLTGAQGAVLLLDAVDQLRADGFADFTVEMNGGRSDAVERFVTREQARPLADRRVVFNGAYDPASIDRRMARVGWCVVPPVHEVGLALAIAAAWRCGRAVIASDAGTPAEEIRDGADGLLFTMGDARELAAALRRAATEPGLWERLVAGIVPQPAADAMVWRMLAVYGLGDAR